MEEINESPNDCIRKIEDIIDIQRANGNLNIRQVAFNLPSEINSTVSANLARSIESSLSKKKKAKKFRSKLSKNIFPDVSWPSDSDITVLRMKMCLTSSEIKENVVQGDGLHQPDSSSMINLATLINESQSQSKQSLIEEFLLPLTSWERQEESEKKNNVVDERKPEHTAKKTLEKEYEIYKADCSSKENRRHNEICSSKDSGVYSQIDVKSKFARFLRLYFCPCCTCLYRMEKMADEPSIYNSRTKFS